MISHKTKYQNHLRTYKTPAICLVLVIAFTIISPSHLVYADYSFSAIQNLSNVGTVVTSQVAVSGSNVYVVWEDSGAADIFFSKSTDGGATFSAPIDLSNDGFSSSPKIAASGNNVYVVWRDSSGGANDILFVESTDSGTTFGTEINVSNNVGESTNQQIAVSGSNVYLAWQDLTPGNNEIFFAQSADSGATFGAPTNLSNNSGSSILPQIAVSGSNVYVTWEDLTSGSGDTFFVRSTDNGATFGSIVNLSNNAGSSITPQIAVQSNNVYVTWDDFTTGNDEIFYSKSTDGGATFNGATLGNPPGSPINLSNSSVESKLPQIAVSGSNVYLVWQEKTTSTNKEVYFVKSTDSGSTFSSAVNLSNNSGNSIAPAITALGNNVGMIWVDSTPGNNDIFFKSSSDNGATFSSVNNLSNTAGDSIFPQLVLSTTQAYATWADENTSPGSFAYDAFFTSGVPSSTNIAFDASEYKLSSTAGISITSPSSNNPLILDSISVNIKSTSDPTGITTSFSETGINTGVFTKSITFSDTSASSGTTLHALPGDTITATFGGTSGTANIFQRSISFDLSSYTPGSKAVITVIDQNSNLNTGSAESIPVTVSSTHNSQVTVNLQETGPDTGFFNSTTNAALNVASYDTITATYKGATATASVIPGTSPGGGGGGLIRPGLVLDAVLAYEIGGGPSIPPSLDLVKLAATPGAIPDDIRNQVLHHDPFKPISPIKSSPIDLPLSIDGDGYALGGVTNTITTEKKEVGKPVDVMLDFLSSSDIVHAGFYLNLPHASDDLYKSDTYIIYEKGKSLQIVDPHKFFDNVQFNITKSDLKDIIDYKITFAKPMNKSDIDFRVWDDRYSSADTRILDALQVVAASDTTNASSIISIHQPSNVTNITSPKNNVTGMMNQKNNTSIMNPQNNPTRSANQTDDTLSAIKMWGGYSSKSISDSELLGGLGMHGKHIPSWLMKSTRLVVNGDISQDEFVSILKYMDGKGLIK